MSPRTLRLVKALAFLGLLSPALALVVRGLVDALGANPIEKITRDTGAMALQCLMYTLALTPLRRLTGWNDLVKFRRMAGLFAFFYAVLHVATYLVLDQFFDWHAIAGDLAKRPYIMAGAVAIGLMTPLAVTSTRGWIVRLGGRNWQRLHRLAYASAIAGVVHYWWLVKADTTSPRRYALVLAVLLGARAWWAWRKRLDVARVAPAAGAQ